jgi:hypothetical protein
VTHHYPRNAISVVAWCRKCWANTPHRIDDRRVGPCLACIEKLNRAHDERQTQEVAASPEAQGELFG